MGYENYPNPNTFPGRGSIKKHFPDRDIGRRGFTRGDEFISDFNRCLRNISEL
jgi:hypothetical protein